MRRIGGVLALALGLLVVHTLHVWGYTGNFWGDIGRWSHEVERMASGELPYRDFQWHYPPLGLWVEGALGWVFGTDRTPLSYITFGLAALIVTAFVFYARDVLDRVDAALVAVALVLAFGHAQTVGAPLPLGLYSPAALVGALCIANAARLFVRSRVSPQPNDVAWMALWAALAVLSKQDFWIPAAYLVGATVVLERRIAPIAVSGAVTLTGVGIVIATAGVGVLLPLAGGFGHATLAGGQGFPSWERITVDLFTLALVVGAFACVVSVVSRRVLWVPLVAAAGVAAITGAVHVWSSMHVVLPGPDDLVTPTQDALRFHLREGNSLLRPAIGWLRHRVSRTPIPVALPPLLLLLTALRWRTLPHPRRVTVALLLGLAIAFRARRAFEGTEWFEFLLTLPVLLASAELLLGLAHDTMRRVRVTTLAIVSLLAVWAYVEHGRGWGTARHHPEVTVTRRGEVHWRENEARDYLRVMATIDSLDPTRQRPVFAFGFSGGWNYWMERKNPFPFTQNFYFSAFDADSVLALARPAGIVLIDNPALARGSFGAARFDLARWEQPRVAAPYDNYDRPRFERLREGCPRVPLDDTMFSIYACP